MLDTLRLLKAISVLDMFIVMEKKDLVLTTVQHQCESMCRGLRGDKKATLARTIMKWKLSDAKRVVKEHKYSHTHAWRKQRCVLIELGVCDPFLRFWESMKKFCRAELRKQKERKIRFLGEKKKVKERANVCDFVEGIYVGDTDVTASFDSQPRLYGGATITPAENELLSLPPGFNVYDKVDRDKCTVEIEKALTKLKWQRKGSSPRDGDGAPGGEVGDAPTRATRGKIFYRRRPLRFS